MEKMGTVAAIETRKKLYDIILGALEAEGMTNQPIKGGSLVSLAGDDEGYFAKVSVSICDPSKIDTYIDAYAEQQAKNAVRAQEAAARAEEKARKAAERAEKKAKKEAEAKT